MVVGAFPIGKLIYLGVKQISRPISHQVKRAAKNNAIFRRWICLPPARAYNWLQMLTKMRTMGAKGKIEAPRMTEETAVELGAELLGEFVVYGIASASLLYEYVRSSRREQQRQESQEDDMQNLTNRVKQLELKLDVKSVELRQLNERLLERNSQIKK